MKMILIGIGTVSLVSSVSVQPLLLAAELPPINVSQAISLPVPIAGDFNYYFSLCKVLRSQQKYEVALSACNQAINLKKRKAEVWAIRSDILFNLRQYEEGLVSGLTAFQLKPKYSFALTLQCRSLSALGQQNEAIFACDRALQVNQNWESFSPDLAWVSRGVAWELKKKYPQALESFEEALKVQPQHSLALASKCRVFSEMGKYEEAIVNCDRALQINSNWGEASLNKAWFWRGLAFTRWGKSAEVLESCSKINSASEREMVAIRECALKNRTARLEAAIDSYNHAVMLNPKDAAAWAQLGVNLSELNRYAQARSALESALQASPNYTFALATLGALLNKLGSYQEALTACEKALQGDSNWEESEPFHALLQKGQALAGLGRYDEALSSVERALSLKPNSAIAWNTKSVIFWQWQKYAEALQANDRAIEIDPNYFQGWLNRGGILRTLKQNQEAITAYDRALASDVRLVLPAAVASVWANRSAVLWHLEQYQEAIHSANEALALDPKSVPAWFNRGLSLESLNQYEEAVLSYQQALHLDPKQAQVWVAQGIALAQLKRYPEAIAAFEEALKVNPNYDIAKQNRDLLREHPDFVNRVPASTIKRVHQGKK